MNLAPLVFGLLALTTSSDWPNFLGPTFDGLSPVKGIRKDWVKTPPTQLWKVDLHDGGYGGPAASRGVLYIVDHIGAEDVLRAINIGTGKEEWAYRYSEEADDAFGFARSTPTIEGDRIYITSRLGKVLCINLVSHQLVWQRDMVQEFKGKRPKWDYSASPVIDGRKLIVCPGGDNAAVVALDKFSGKTIWQGGGSGITGYSTPVIATINGKRQYVMYLFTSIEGIDAENGQVLWSFPWSDWSGVSAARPVVAKNTVFVTSGYERGSALLEISDSGVKAKWDIKALESEFSSPVLSGGHLYCTSAKGNLVCVEFATGVAKWRQPGFEKGGLIEADGCLIVMNGSNGEVSLVKIDPSGYRELGKMAGLGGQSWTAPIIANDCLIIRNRKMMASYRLKP